MRAMLQQPNETFCLGSLVVQGNSKYILWRNWDKVKFLRLDRTIRWNEETSNIYCIMHVHTCLSQIIPTSSSNDQSTSADLIH